MKSLPLTEIRMLGPFVAAMEDMGAPVNTILDAHNISREMLQIGQGKITTLQFYQCLAASDIPDLGYQVGLRNGMQFMGPVGQSVLRSANLKDAIATFAAHLGRWMSDKQLWLEPCHDQVWLWTRSNDGLEQLQQHTNQCGLMTLISLVREVAGKDWIPRAIRVDTNEASVRQQFPILEGSAVEQVSHGVAIRFPLKFLSRSLPSLSSTQSLDPILQPGPLHFTPALERTLRDQFSFIGLPTIDQTAEIAGTSVRSLQRKLSDDGLTYQRLADRIRFQIARQRLEKDPTLSVHELSIELNYGTASSFIRAFHRISGVTPTVYRKNLGQRAV